VVDSVVKIGSELQGVEGGREMVHSLVEGKTEFHAPKRIGQVIDFLVEARAEFEVGE
jgi:hypothetical protein